MQPTLTRPDPLGSPARSSAVILTPKDSEMFLRLKNAVPKADLEALGERPPPSLLKDRPARCLIYPLPRGSVHRLADSFDQLTHHPVIDVQPGHIGQTWFNKEHSPLWVRCELTLHAYDEEPGPQGEVMADGYILTASLMLMDELKLKLLDGDKYKQVNKIDGLGLTCASELDDGSRLCATLHSQHLVHFGMSKRNAKARKTLQVLTAPGQR